MVSKIYLDNNATTQIDNDVLNEMLPYLKEQYGNPSSIYSFGKQIKEKINIARNRVAKLLNASSEDIIFTSCGSESNITAIMSAIRLNPEKKHIITTKVEHASIMETMKYLENTGYSITYLNVDQFGRIDLNELKEKISKDACLISIMMANNEIGNIYPIKEIVKIAHENNIIMHSDAVQAAGKIKIDVKDLEVDLLSISGHKINAPKGIGALYIKDSSNFNPLIFGHQEKERRGGTENVPNIVGFGKAAESITNDNFEQEKEIENLRNYMEEKIKSSIEDVHIYGDIENRIPNTSSIAFKGARAEEIMFVLESYNIFVSTGSACNSEIAVPSHVLTACHADLENYSPIRISLGKYNTKEEIDIFINELIKTIKMLRKRGR